MTIRYLKLLKIRNYLVLSFFGPLWIFLLSLTRRNTLFFYTSFISLCVYLGFIFIPGDLSNIYEGGDNVRYILFFEKFLKMRDQDVLLIFRKDYYVENIRTEIFVEILMYVVSFFSRNILALIVIFHFVYGVLYMKLLQLLNFQLNKISFSQKLSQLYLFLLVPVWYVNSFRFWIATIFFVLGIIAFLRKERHYYYLILAVASHITFIFPFTVFIFCSMCGGRKLFYSLVYVYVGVLLSGIKINISELEFLAENFALGKKINAYSNLEYIELISDRQNYSWHIIVANYIQRIVSFLVYAKLCLINKNRDKCLNSAEMTIINTTLLVNIISTALNLQDLGRFVITMDFMLIAFILYKSEMNFNYRNLIFICCLLFFFMVRIRTGMDYYGIDLFFNYATIPLEFNEPLINFVK